ncbi:MAG: sigma-54 dependent transcriptional regulator, partial [Planctomycetes bacterium]|nr:sigma-54 dependent transcriptional regulator [Planctomycetota bacterium]
EVTVLTSRSAEEGLKLAEDASGVDAILLDIMLPDVSGLAAFEQFREQDSKRPVIFITADSTSETAIQAMTKGAYDYLVKPLNLPQLREVVQKALETRRLMSTPVAVGDEDKREEVSGETILGKSPAMQDVYKAIGRVAGQDVTVLVQGESGTGKELVARAIYHYSRRKDGPFLAVNCAAIPESLLESELFGHEKGAFTGADRRRIGKFEQCSGGTIFLDEIGDMPGLLQAKMLRLLQQQTFERVGGRETIKVDVRIIAATNRDLKAMVEEGEFREDLYYRLRGFLINLPPLRERGEDIEQLIQNMLMRFSRELDKPVTGVASEAMQLLRSYYWPGNVRELENVMRQAVLQTTGPVITPEFLPSLDGRPTSPLGPHGRGVEGGDDVESFVSQRLGEETTDLYNETLEVMERILLTRVLNHTHGNQSQAARILGISRSSLRNKLRTLDISISHVVNGADEDDE